MKLLKGFVTSGLILGATLLTGVASADDNRAFEVTVTNITKGEIFTPIMVASHQHGVKLFEIGEPVDQDLEILAEGGNTGPLSTSLLSSGLALDVVTAGGPLLPGHSVTLQVMTNKKNAHVSVASMLVPSNDAFFAVNGIHGPRGKKSFTVYSPAYDAGSEINDELCANIPGPPFACTGEGFNEESGEGYVYIHPGIQGNGDLDSSAYDWNNPVAKITIKRIKIKN